MNWKILVGGVAVAIPLVWVLASGFGTDPRGVSDALEGREAPAFTLPTIDGGEVSSKSLEGHPVVLNFWATWCGPCATEHPALLALARRYRPKGVTFLGVLYNDDAEKAISYLAKHGQAYPNLLDPGQRVAIDFGVAGVPETFVIDAQGRIAKKYVGPIDPTGMAKLLDSLL